MTKPHDDTLLVPNFSVVRRQAAPAPISLTKATQSSAGRFFGPKYSERRCVAMQKGTAAHRPDLPVTEKTTERDFPYILSETIAVVVGDSIKVLPASQTGE